MDQGSLEDAFKSKQRPDFEEKADDVFHSTQSLELEESSLNPVEVRTYAGTPPLSSTTCRILYIAETWFAVVAVTTSEVYALAAGIRSLQYLLLGQLLVFVVSSFIIMAFFSASVEGLTCLMIGVGTARYRRSASILVRVLYRDGVLYYAILFSISLVQIVVMLTGPLEHYDLLVQVQQVLHTVLACRVWVNARKAAGEVDTVGLRDDERPISMIRFRGVDDSPLSKANEQLGTRNAREQRIQEGPNTSVTAENKMLTCHWQQNEHGNQPSKDGRLVRLPVIMHPGFDAWASIENAVLCTSLAVNEGDRRFSGQAPRDVIGYSPADNGGYLNFECNDFWVKQVKKSKTSRTALEALVLSFGLYRDSKASSASDLFQMSRNAYLRDFHRTQIVALVWSGQWKKGNLLYLTSRLLPFVDVPLGVFYWDLYLALTDINALAFTLAGMLTAEAMLALMIYALTRSKFVRNFLIGQLSVLAIGTSAVTAVFYTSATFTKPILPLPTGCFPSSGNYLLLALGFTSLAFNQFVLTCLMIGVGITQYRHSTSSLVRVLYRDGVAYYCIIFLISLSQVVMLLVGPNNFRFTNTQKQEYSDLLTPVWIDARKRAGGVNTNGLRNTERPRSMIVFQAIDSKTLPSTPPTTPPRTNRTGLV
ncbi:hypothetical protein FA15DRAFT_654268 [Coprinopsis marcescibilis]|uniref:Transmembrane protein n=1 Tax=Coprinopsis marcescibilis TaxID=230819 RepID=A0A5C3L1C5_COPMA|nr:hypothetical protein FA15DRAFT_654268 [Coprinopsis marcescibilis]